MFDGLRKSLNGSPIVAGGLAAVAVAVMAYILIRGGSRYSGLQCYFTTDHGKTYYLGPARATPYTTAGGTEVDEAMLFTCSKDGKPFVGYVRRFSQKNRAAAEAAFRMQGKGPPPPDEVMKPGGTAWVEPPDGGRMGPPPQGKAAGSTEYDDIKQVHCPDGKLAIMQFAH